MKQTRYVNVHATGLTLVLTRDEFFKGVDRANGHMKNLNAEILESENVVREPKDYGYYGPPSC